MPQLTKRQRQQLRDTALSDLQQLGAVHGTLLYTKTRITATTPLLRGKVSVYLVWRNDAQSSNTSRHQIRNITPQAIDILNSWHKSSVNRRASGWAGSLGKGVHNKWTATAMGCNVVQELSNETKIKFIYGGDL